MERINFSIVIPTWNRSKLLDTLLLSLYEDRQTYKYGDTEILVVDSSSGEEKKCIKGSCEKYDARFIEGVDSVRKKRNKGIDLAQYEYILFIDSDVKVKQGLLNSHAEGYLNSDNKVAGTFGLTEFVGEKKFWWKILELTSFIDSFSFAKKYPYVSWTIGNNVSFQKKVLLEIGKFEENFPYKLGGDDLDMTYRVTKAGYLIKTVPEALTYHSTQTWNNWKAINDRSKRWGTMEYFILKRHPELVHRRLPMVGDLIFFMFIVFGIVSLIKWSFVPLAFFAVFALLTSIFSYIFYVKNHQKTNIFYWSIAMLLQGKYRFHRLLISVKKMDFSLLFKGQYFGIYHIKSDFQTNAKKMWIYCLSFVCLIFLMAIYKLFIA